VVRASLARTTGPHARRQRERQRERAHRSRGRCVLSQGEASPQATVRSPHSLSSVTCGRRKDKAVSVGLARRHASGALPPPALLRANSRPPSTDLDRSRPISTSLNRVASRRHLGGISAASRRHLWPASSRQPSARSRKTKAHSAQSARYAYLVTTRCLETSRVLWLGPAR